MTEVDHVLRNQVAQVNRLVTRLGEQVGQVSGQVSAVGAAQQQTQSELQQLRADFLAFARRAELTANVQRAETRIGVIQDQVDHEFGHHKTIRRTAVGLLQAFDVGLVSEDTVRTVSEQLMIQTPRYWLAPTLVALAAWSADEPTLCERAVEEAFRRSPERTSLFFALVLRRQGRQHSAVRWLRHYLLTQDPAALGREFAVILESISQGAFGPVGRELLRATLDRWREILLQDDQARAAQVARWRAEIESLRTPSAAGRFPRLSAVSPQWAQLDSVLSSAGAQQAVLTKYTALLAQESKPSERLEDAIDDILDRLVSEYDNEELPLRRDLAFNRAVVEHHGDVQAARHAVDVDSASLEETLDILTVQSTAALNPAAIGASTATQRLAVAACQEWFADAHAGFSRDYRMAQPPDVQAAFTATHTAGTKAFNLPPWYGSFNTPLETLEQSLSQHWDQHMQPFLDALVYPWKRQAILLGGVLLLILLVIGQASVGVALFGAVLVALIWGGMIYLRSEAARKAVESTRQLLERARNDSLHQLRGAAAELTDWQSAYREADQVEPATREFIASLATAVHAQSPFDGRAVRPGPDGTPQGDAK
ncbi:hypothetical protein GCM10010430_28170 [Kitasatospora cystarginea]|uniref:Uncharacterized protein n=1 Tax=Kitasatospora cystarginea TaxID=58350 RepID=A0ABN3DYP2_9ACTN